MARLLLVNIDVSLNYEETFFRVGKYIIFPTGNTNKKNIKQHQQNAYVEFQGKQLNSIIYKGGTIVNRLFFSVTGVRKRKIIEDILIIGTLLTGSNWGLYSQRNLSNFPLITKPNLTNIQLHGKENIELCFKVALQNLCCPKWQLQFDNGFHLRMILNVANIFNQENRFLANMVIWEWLYPHLKNPNGATPKDEIDDLPAIFIFILRKYWPHKKKKINQHRAKIFRVLRNQLAHSGKIPINRDYADSWMKELEWDPSDSNFGIINYLNFFDSLTQIIVLKTIGIDAESIAPRLDNFLTTGHL